MKIIDGMDVQEIICLYMSHGDDFLQCIESAAREKDIQSGVVLSAIGTFDRVRIRHIKHTQFPGEMASVELEGPVELCSVDGIIADYKPHLHTTMSIRGKELISGHLAEGCSILYLGEVVIAKLKGRVLAREDDPASGTPRLVARQ